MNIKNKLEELMKERGLNVRALSIDAGINYGTMRSIFRQGGDIRASTILKLAKYFGCTTDYLLDNTINEDKYEIQRLYNVAPERIQKAVDALLKEDY